MADRKRCRKRRFRSETDARITLVVVAADRERKGAPKAEKRAYRCPNCHGWHLTSEPTNPRWPPVRDEGNDR